MRLHPRDLLNHTLVLLDRDGIECANVTGGEWLPFAASMAHGYDRTDADQRGAPDPWLPEFSDWEWETMRLKCALVALGAAFEGIMKDSPPGANPVAQKRAAVSEPRGSHHRAQTTTNSSEVTATKGHSMRNDRIFDVGDEGRDTVSGYTGIVISIHEYLNGCRRITICPKCKDDGTFMDERTFDEPQMELLQRRAWKGPVAPLRETGGYHADTPRTGSR